MLSMSQPSRSPQLLMGRDRLDDLEPVILPAGYTLCCYAAHLTGAWESIISRTFEWSHSEGIFLEFMRRDCAFRPERVLFVLNGEQPVGTASAWFRPEYGRQTGYLHMVAVLPEHAGHGLGRALSLACLHRMAAERRTRAVLQTDDFRLAAIATYLKLGFAPWLVHENQRQRWTDVFAVLQCPELTERFRSYLDAPLYETPPARGNADRVERYALRRRWLPHRQHRGGVGGGDTDFMGDESLYRSSRLGIACIEPREVSAGSVMTQPLTFSFRAGPDGLPFGATVVFAVRGQNPLGFPLVPGRPEVSGGMRIEEPPGCTLEPVPMGFRIAGGRLRPGETVRLIVARPQALRWTPIAGRREIKVTVSLPDDDCQRRLPEPLVLTVVAGPVHRLEATTRCTRAPDQPLHVRVTARDAFDNRAWCDGEVTIASDDVTSQRVPIVGGFAEGILPASPTAVVRPNVELVGLPLRTKVNPSLAVDGLHYLVGDLHCHDFLSEAEGYSDAVYRWAMEDRNLDFVSVVPQTHGWLDNETWTLVRYMNERFLDEGRFVTFLGFEWQHTGYGDKVIHYLGGDQPYLPPDDARYDSAPKLYEALRATDALVISHHPAYPEGAWCPMTDFDVVETDVERLVELWSMHGSAEGYDPADRPYAGTMDERGLVLGALRRGVRLGFVGGSDTHSGRPGGSVREPRPHWGGLAAVWAEALTRRALFDALRARRTVALTGARILLAFHVNDAWMGSELPSNERAQIRIDVIAPETIASVELLKNGVLLRRFSPALDEFHLQYEDRTGGAAFYHCRVTQVDGHLAVCSPVWIG